MMRLLARLNAHPAAVAYSMTTLGAGMMNSIFNFYYVKLFLNKYKISEGAFHQSQVSTQYLPTRVTDASSYQTDNILYAQGRGEDKCPAVLFPK